MPAAESPQPYEWFVWSVCEAFQIPIVAGGFYDQPADMTSRIMRLRQYRMAHDLVEMTGEYAHLKDAKDYQVPPWAAELVDTVKVLREAYELEQERERAARDEV